MKISITAGLACQNGSCTTPTITAKIGEDCSTATCETGTWTEPLESRKLIENILTILPLT